MICDWSRLGIYICDIFEIQRILEEESIRTTLSEIARDCGTDPLCPDIDPSSESDIPSEVEMLLSDAIEFTFWDIDKFVECKEFIFGLVPST
jgi:hypothetical protein